jgi:hypothetical protein
MLEGVSNFTSWKYRLQMLLKEVELWVIKDKNLVHVDLAQLVDYKKKETKEK